jgi:NADPH:quinone reductase-like Zn-dependent oxidoreductase
LERGRQREGSKIVRAIAISSLGEPPELTDVPVPTPEEGEILVRVEASSVNGFDLVIASGQARSMMEYQFPVVLGRDFAGTVAATECCDVTVGDRVFGMITKPYLKDGGFAEYLTVSGSFGVARIPDDLSTTDAGALALAGTTAEDSVTAAAPRAGQKVLISGATGGVGAIATQLVTALGATVIATARPGAEEEFARAMGATHTVDYTDDVVAQVMDITPRGVDSVIHLAGDPKALGGLVRRGGRFASTRGVSSIDRSDAIVTAISASPTQDTLSGLAEAVAESRLLVPLTRIYTLAETPKALQDFAQGTIGKLGVTIT